MLAAEAEEDPEGARRTLLLLWWCKGEEEEERASAHTRHGCPTGQGGKGECSGGRGGDRLEVARDLGREEEEEEEELRGSAALASCGKAK